MISFSKEQIFIVTGASSGIGESVAILLNELGASVVAIARNAERLQMMKAKCPNPENVFLEQKDLAQDIENLPNFVKTLKDKYGKFSGLAYCAGVSALMPLKAVTYDYARGIFDINYFAPLMMIKAMSDKRNNVGAGTSIVCISSADAVFGTKGQNVYSASKAALCLSAKAISKEITPQGVRINCVLPSMIKTPMSQDAAVFYSNEAQFIYSLSYPFGFGEPSDVANFICYLLSSKAKFLSGQNYILDSGGGGGCRLC